MRCSILGGDFPSLSTVTSLPPSSLADLGDENTAYTIDTSSHCAIRMKGRLRCVFTGRHLACRLEVSAPSLLCPVLALIRTPARLVRSTSPRRLL